MSQAIKVVVRVRPMNTKQITRGCKPILNPDEKNNQISIVKPEEEDNVKAFAFDYVFPESSEQALVYQKTAFKLVQNVIEGYNGTIFAYGQTGCGKTHSMVGKLDVPELQGIIPRTFTHILSVVSEFEKNQKSFFINCSFIEIYNQEVHDLLGKDVKAKLDIKEHLQKGLIIKDLKENPARTYDQMMNYMNIGNGNRSVGETLMNKDSSRSHSIFMIRIDSVQKTPTGEDRIVSGKLNLVDLAGSQRISKTGAAGDRLKEAQKINLSLSALGNVISALVDGKSQHIPYRDSKLTRLLQDSLGGNTKTVMIANCSPADYNFDETLSTLRYASRAKFIKNKPIINEDPKDALIKEYAQQIKKLKMMLEGGKLPAPQVVVVKAEDAENGSESSEMKQKLQEKESELEREKRERQKLEDKIREMQAQTIVATQIKLQKAQLDQLAIVRKHIQENKQTPSAPREDPKTVQRNEEEEQILNKKFKSLAEENESYKKTVKNQRSKIKALERELKDINEENYADKESYLEDLRLTTKQNKLYLGILNMLLTGEQLDLLKSSAEYLQEKQDYKIPAFYFKSKKLVFPKLAENQAIQMINEYKENRELIVEKHQAPKKSLDQNTLHPSKSSVNMNSTSNKSLKPSEEQQFSLNNIIKNARTGEKSKANLHVPDGKAIAGVNLEPIEPRQVREQVTETIKPVRKGQLSPLQK